MGKRAFASVFWIVLLMSAPESAMADALPLINVPFGADIAPGEAAAFRVDIDHGTTPQALTVTAIAAITSNEVAIALYDLDEYAAGGATGLTTSASIMPGAQGLGCEYITGLRSGVHSVVAVITCPTPAITQTFTGGIGISAGAITLTGSAKTQNPLPDGIFSLLWWRASRKTTFTSGADNSTTVQVGLGPSPQAITFRVDALASSGILEVAVYDTTVSPPALLSLFSGDAGGGVSATAYVTLPAYSGVAAILVDVTTNGSPGDIEWHAAFPSMIPVLAVADGDHGTASLTSAGGDDDDAKCAAGNGGPLLPSALLVLLAALISFSALRSRRAG